VSIMSWMLLHYGYSVANAKARDYDSEEYNMIDTDDSDSDDYEISDEDQTL
jgi:hypothetical protein